MFMRRPEATFVVILVVVTMLWIVFFIVQQHRTTGVTHSIAQSALKSSMPLLATRINKQVMRLERETPLESVVKLSDVNAFYFPGPTIGYVQLGIPLSENVDLMAVDTIMSNRRFLKVLSELGKLDKVASSQIVKAELLHAITNYSRLYDSDIRQQAPDFKISTNAPQFGPGFQMSVLPEEEGKEVLLGARLKVLSLVWVSGILRLTDNKEFVEQVVRLAVKQRMQLYNDSTLEPVFKSEMLRMASLYNRQILAAGLIGVTFKEEGLELNVMKKIGIEWQQRKLAAYDAVLTEFDKPVVSGVMAPDYSVGSITVNFASPMSDAKFDILLQELHFNK